MREKLVEGSDRAAARVAARQHGVVTTDQLRGSGIDKSGIGRRVRAGRLHRVHRGVYAVGHEALSVEGRWLAAVLAYGGGAVLSHRSAAELWGFLPPEPATIPVTVAGASGRTPRRGIRLHRCPSLPRSATTRRTGIPVTIPARTIGDLRRVAPGSEVRRAIRQAEFLGRPTGDHGRRDRTRSELERRFLAICRRHHLTPPEVNVRVGRFTVDFLWREQRFIVETDGYAAHRGRQAFEDDRARDNELMAGGYDVLRFTQARVATEPDEVVAVVRARLSR